MRPIDRRTVLRGAGIALALPWLEAMGAPRAWGARAPAPRRLVFVFAPNGFHMPDWTPASTADDFALPRLLEPLAPVRDRVLVLSGLAHDNARAKGDGPGDHARSAACFLTGAHPKKTAGADIRCGVSADQLAAQRLGTATRFASIELGTEPARQSGDCDSGYSCAYSSCVSWRTPHQPVASEIRPKLVFDRLFGAGPGTETPEGRERRWRERRSILDWVAADAERLRGQLGATDRRKLAEYQDSVREVERQVAALATGGPDAATAGALQLPEGVPTDYRAHVRLQYELLALALRLDLTRVATFMVANEGSNRNYGFVGAPGGHHHLSHHGGDPDKIEGIRRINRFHVELFVEFVQKLAAIAEGDGTLLDGCAVVFGSAIADGNAHNHDDLPLLVAGRAGGAITTGRHLRFPAGTPACNLFVSLLGTAGVKVPSFGDSTGPLPGLG
jgi:hypothetical protein